MDLFIRFLYQPFFNLLIGFYVLLERIPGVIPDMGIAVILMTIVMRILLLPLSLSSTRTKKERYELEQSINKIQKSSPSPEVAKQRLRSVFGTNRRIVVSEAVNFAIQVAIFFILYRMFSRGLEGEDLNLIYSFMPQVTVPFNLLFLGRFDLAHPNMVLNFFQSLVILAVEAATLIDSPFPKNRGDFIRYIIILPVASFVIFAFLPSGKKLFIITTLIFSLCFISINILTRAFGKIFDRIDAESKKKVEQSNG